MLKIDKEQLNMYLKGSPPLGSAFGFRKGLIFRLEETLTHINLIRNLTKQDLIRALVVQAVFSICLFTLANALAAFARRNPGPGVTLHPIAADATNFALISLAVWIAWMVFISLLFWLLTPPTRVPETILTYDRRTGLIRLPNHTTIQRSPKTSVAHVLFRVRRGGRTDFLRAVSIHDGRKWQCVAISTLYAADSCKAWCQACGITNFHEVESPSRDTLVIE